MEDVISPSELLQDQNVVYRDTCILGMGYVGLTLAMVLADDGFQVTGVDPNPKVLEALRTIFLIPMVLPPIVVAIIWKVLYTPDISPFHWATESLGFVVPSLITDPGWALWAIIIADIWEWFPFVMLMILSALQMMPEEYIEAAKIDGANVWQMTWYVTMPYLKGVMIVAALFRVVDSIKAFPLIYILTDGGPGSLTEVTNFYSFMQAFNFSYLGYSSAITVTLVIATILASWGIIRLVGWGRPIE